MLRLKGMILFFCILVLFMVPVVAANVVISEVMYNPDQCDDSDCEWIELYNNGTEPINLSEWQIKSTASANWKEFDDIIIEGGERIIIARELIDGGDPDTESFEAYWGNGNGVWDSSDGSYDAIDGNFASGLVNSDDIVSIGYGNETVISTFNYGPSYGANGDNNTLQLMVNGSICASTPTPGAATNCPSCGNGNCDANENCASCPADCKKCDGESCSLNGDCASSHCVHGICRATDPYCGDNYCDTGENCPSDNASCADNKCYEPTCTNGCGQTAVATNGTDEACTSTSGCANPPCKCDGSGNCTSTAPTHRCGDGTCDANETCSCSDCEGKQNNCTSGQLCCSGSCTSLCFSDAGCPSEKTCLNAGTCNATCVNASSIVCDLTLSILSEDIFNVSVTQNYYLYANDTKSNYTGSALVTYWIEDSKGAYIKYHKPENTTLNANINKSREYTPAKICGNETYYIRAEIAEPRCNDINLANNAATKTIKIWGLDPNSTECFKNLTYELEIPVEVKAEEEFIIKIEISNNLNVSQSVEVWSYIYRGAKCYSCYNNETEESNKQVINISAKSSVIVELQNRVNATNGTYYIKVKILKEGFSTPEEFTYSIDVKEKERIEINETITANETGNVTGEVIYKSKSEKVKKIAIYILCSLLVATAVYFAIAKRKQIGEFIAAKKQEFEKKRKWKEYIQKRRPGVIKRLSEGFLKPGEKVSE